MSGLSATASNRANFVTADHCGNRRRALRLNSAVMQKTRDVFPVKTARHLADMTGYSLRTCEYWLSGDVVIPSDALACLLHSDRGREFLAVVMSDATPRWWIATRAWLARVSFEAFKRRHQREMRELLDADFSSPSAAQMFQDEEFYSAQPAPSARAPHAMVGRKAR